MQVRLANGDRAGGVQSRGDDGVSRRDVIGEDFGARGGADTLRSDEILVGNRYTVEGASFDTARKFLVAYRCLGQRGFTGDSNEGVQAGVQARDLPQRFLDQLTRRD